MGFTYKRGRIWWIAYGPRCLKRESAETAVEEEARDLLKLREGDVVKGKPIPDPKLKRITVATVLNSFIDHQVMMGKKSAPHVKRYYVDNFLIPMLGQVEVRALKTARLNKVVLELQEHGYSNSHINKIMAALNRALVLAERDEVIQSRPYVPLLKPNAPREGFWTRQEFERLVQAMSNPRRAHALPVIQVLRYTGARISEVLRLEWRHINLAEGWIRLEGGTTKNGEGRTLPILPALHPTLATLWEQRMQRGELVPWVFEYQGKRLASIRTAFEDACVEAGVKRTLHDFRRTLRRDMEQAGIQMKVGMAILGHKDAKTYQAYMPVIDDDKRAAAERLERVVSQ